MNIKKELKKLAEANQNFDIAIGQPTNQTFMINGVEVEGKQVMATITFFGIVGDSPDFKIIRKAQAFGTGVTVKAAEEDAISTALSRMGV